MNRQRKNSPKGSERNDTEITPVTKYKHFFSLRDFKRAIKAIVGTPFHSSGSVIMLVKKEQVCPTHAATLLYQGESLKNEQVNKTASFEPVFSRRSLVRIF